MNRSIILLVVIFVLYFGQCNIVTSAVNEDERSHRLTKSEETKKPQSKRKITQSTQYMEENRERMKLTRQSNFEKYKKLDHKNYLKRKSDPIIHARDKEMRRIHYEQNREKVNASKRESARKKRQRRKEEKIRVKVEGMKGKRSRTNSNVTVHDTNEQNKRVRMTPVSKKGESSIHEQSSTRTIAHLKLSPETINKFYGPKNQRSPENR